MDIVDALREYFYKETGVRVPGDDIVEIVWNATHRAQKMERIAPFLYNAVYDNIDYAAGTRYWKKYKPVLGGCSAMLSNGFLGRNYDWTYDNRVSVVVHSSATQGRHKVLGIASAPSDITMNMIEHGKTTDSYAVIPFMLLDGINDAGLVCEINVVPAGDKGKTTGTNPMKPDLCATMIPRFVLDYAGSVDEAISLLQNRNVFSTYSDTLEEEYHFMLVDATKTVVIEFVNNEMVVIDSFVDDKPISTNFYLHGYNGSRSSLSPHAMGIERYAILAGDYDDVEDETDMRTAMQNVTYTQAYLTTANPVWYSEFNGKTDRFGDLTINSPTSAYAGILAWARNEFQNRSRNNPITWQTVHSSVYDLETRTLYVSCQEEYGPFKFNLAFDNQIFE